MHIAHLVAADSKQHHIIAQQRKPPARGCIQRSTIKLYHAPSRLRRTFLPSELLQALGHVAVQGRGEPREGVVGGEIVAVILVAHYLLLCARLRGRRVGVGKGRVLRCLELLDRQLEHGVLVFHHRQVC